MTPGAGGCGLSSVRNERGTRTRRRRRHGMFDEVLRGGISLFSVAGEVPRTGHTHGPPPLAACDREQGRATGVYRRSLAVATVNPRREPLRCYGIIPDPKERFRSEGAGIPAPLLSASFLSITDAVGGSALELGGAEAAGVNGRDAGGGPGVSASGGGGGMACLTT